MLSGLVQSPPNVQVPQQRTATRGRCGVVVLWIPVLVFIVVASLVSAMLRFFRGPSCPNRIGHEPKTNVIKNAYARWAPVYDFVCGPIFINARRASARAARALGGRVLEIGVGTGLSLGHYEGCTEVIGIDISAPMIARAQERMPRHPYVKELLQMDAANLDFEDQSFDCVVAQFVITLVENPETVLSECARVLRPGGEIILVNHFYSETGLAARIERWASHYARPLGLRSEFPLLRLLSWAQDRKDIDLIDYCEIAPLSAFTLVRFGRIKPSGTN
jgi:phosphatidylethanolamine/phosphatidyl-N-methylethanolamine N-methyltransferase